MQLKDVSAYEQAISIALKEIDNSLSTKNIAIPISKNDKHSFISEILQSKNNTYTPFETALIEAIPLLENLKGGIELEYSRKDMLSDLQEICPNNKKFNQILEKIGITISAEENKDGIRVPVSYDGFIDINKLNIDDEVEFQAYDIMLKYLFENSVNTEDDELNRYLNTIIKAMPEFINIIGKQQHKTQKHSLDVHCLLALAYSVQNPDYQKLSPMDKTILKFCALVHDIAKKELIVDSGHQYLSSEYVKDISSKFFAHPHVQKIITEFVCNHHWLAEFSKDHAGFSFVSAADDT